MRSSPATYLRAVRSAAAIFFGWTLISLGILAAGRVPLDDAAVYEILVPFFLLFFIGLISWSCAAFTLFQEPSFRRLPGLRRSAFLVSLGIGAALVYLLRHTGVARDVPLVLASANLLVFALLAGNALVSALKKPSDLIPVCIVMSAADLFSVFAGPSKRIAAQVETYYRGGQAGPVPWSDFLLVKIAVPGISHPLPVFGVADVVILSFLIAAAHKFRLRENLAGPSLEAIGAARFPSPYLSVTALGLASASLAAQFFHLFLPALPVMALFFLAATLPRHPRMRRLQRTEWLALLIGFAFLVGLATALPGLL